MLRSLAFAATLAFSVTAAQGQVWVVDQAGGPGAHFTEIQPAVDAASDGDVVLVRPIVSIYSGPLGYQGFVVDGKSLTISADAPKETFHLGQLWSTVPDAVVIRGLAPTQSVAVIGLRQHPGAEKTDGVRIEGCAGSVLLQDCTLSGRGGSAIHVEASPAVTLVRSNVDLTYSGHDSTDPADLSYGLHVIASSVFLYRGSIEGAPGAGSFPLPLWGMDGSDAMVVDGGFVFCSGTKFRGGSGGFASLGPCGTGGDGGTGVVLLGGAVVHALDAEINGGYAGPGCVPGVGGAPLDASGGTFVVVPGNAYVHDSTFDVPAYGGRPLVGKLKGKKDELAFVLVSPAMDPTYLPSLSGPLVPSQPLIVLFLGAVPSTGSIAISAPVAPMTVATGAIALAAQALFVDPAGTGVGVLGTPAQVLLADAAFAP